MRTILGPKLAAFSIHRQAAPTAPADGSNPNPASPVAKSDPQPTFKGMETTAEPLAINFGLAPYDVASSNKLVSVDVYIVPSGHGEPSSVADWQASSYTKGSYDTSQIQAGGDFKVPVPGVPEGDFSGQVLLTYDA